MGNLSFGQAIKAAKSGKKVARKGWNGSGMFAYIVPANSYPAQTGVAKDYFGEGAMVPYREYWALKTPKNEVSTWEPSGDDSLSDDWMIVGEESKYLPYQQRVVDEKIELDEKIEKLEAFLSSPIFLNLETLDQDARRNQLNYMRGYSSTLHFIIKRF